MSIEVIAWPPVGAVLHEWTWERPVAESRSLITGAAYRSVAKRARRLARVAVSARSAEGQGAGYMEMLKRMLDGGVNAVRLHSLPINVAAGSWPEREWRLSAPVAWTDGADDLVWTDAADDLLWYRGRVLTCSVTTDGGWPAVAVTGLPPNRRVARPAEFVQVFEDAADTTGAIRQVLTEAWSDGSGAATIRLYEAAPFGGRINIGVSDTAVFQLDGEMPRAAQPVRGDWTYEWRLREVFADEVGGFTEVDPWR